MTRVSGVGDEAAASLADQIRIHRALGLDGLELRTVDGRGLYELTDAQAALMAVRVLTSGLEVPVVATPIGGRGASIGAPRALDLAILRRTAEIASLVGCRHLRVMSYPNDGRPDAEWRKAALARLTRLTRLAEDLDVVLLHENRHGWASRSAAASVELVTTVDSPNLRLLFDTGNGLAHGYDALPFLWEVLPWVAHVHVRDGVRTEDGAEFAVPGDGEVGVADCLRLLADAGYDGWYSLEPHVARIPHLGVTADPATLEAGYRTCAEKFLTLLDRGGARTGPWPPPRKP
ncbi:sugar phosphate isomerase/epimerase family protein [Actinophytocola sp. NPDC049390]|uniref:sugar phosphate isomerase/epimerase family protein n=1 Tax=Actinophytocola sp. NPDC049390 TaxID=3363894 RepID=UPI00379D83C4